MLTAKKLIDYLKQFPDDTPIYYMEMNTGDWQQIPDFSFNRNANRKPTDGNIMISSIEAERILTKIFLDNIYLSKPDKDELVKNEIIDIFKYVDGNNGICIRT